MSTTARRISSLLVLLALMFTAVVPPKSAFAQLLPGTSSSSSSETGEDAALNTFLDEARKSGARVIVVDPAQTNQPATTDDSMPMAMAFSNERLLAARAEFPRLIARVANFLPLLPTLLVNMDDGGNFRWLINAIITAIGGLICGRFVFQAATRWGREHFQNLYRPEDKRTSAILAYVLGRAGWMFLSVSIAFLTAIIVAIVVDSGHEPTRRTVFVIVSTYTIYRIMRSVVLWNFFMPDTPSHRLINLSDEAATRLFRHWSIALTVVALIVGPCRWIAYLDIDEDLRRVSYMFALLVSALIFAGITILHRRELVSIILGYGDPASKPRWLKVIAYSSVPLTLLYLGLAWFVSTIRLTLGLPGGFLPLAAPFIIFVAAIFIYGVLLLMIERYFEGRERLFRKRQIEEARAEMKAWRRAEEARKIAEGMSEEARDILEEGEEMTVRMMDRPQLKLRKYTPVFKPFLESVVRATILVVSLGEIARLWGIDVGREGGHPLTATLDVVLVILVTISAYRTMNSFIDHKIVEEGGKLDDEPDMPGESDNEGGVGQSRLATLLPIFRNVISALLFVVAGTTVLSYLGVNIAPLFAGAGVVGIAIGFGAQTLIRDIFSGAFFLVDDAFRKGEYIELDQVKGVVEKISMRSFQLRHHLGALHTVPFGEIHSLTNYSRDWVMMKLPLRVTYDTDVERVRKLVKKLGQELLEDDVVGHLFLQPLKSQGVYKMEDSAMIIRVKFMTRPGDQFVTRKVVYARIRELFEKEGIHFAHREVTVRLADEEKASELTEEQKKAVVGSVRSALEEEPPVPAAAAPSR